MKILSLRWQPLLALVIILALFAFLSNYLATQRNFENHKKDIDGTQTGVQEPLSETQEKELAPSVAVGDYYLRNVGACDEYGSCPQRLYQRTGEGDILIDASFENDTAASEIESRKGGLLYLSYITHKDGGSYYIYDVATHQRIESHDISVVDYVLGDTLSPDSTKILRMSRDGSKLVVTDVFAQSNRTVASVTGRETFIGEIEGMGGDEVGRFAWINDSTISFDVFSQDDVLDLNHARTAVRSATTTIADIQ